MTTTTTTTSMPAWVQPYAQGYLQRAQQVADMPYQPYQGDRVAGFNTWQQQGLNAMANRAMQGSPLTQRAQDTAAWMMNPQGQNASWNPQANVQAAPGAAGVFGNTTNQGFISTPAGAAPVQASSNPYLGMNNPFLTQQIDAAQGDLVRAWNNVAAPQFDTAMARSGSFGNEGVRQAAGFAAADLQRNLGRVASDMRMGDYLQQLQLGESDANRRTGVSQFNAGLGEAQAGRTLQTAALNNSIQEANINRALDQERFNAGLFEADAAREMQAALARAQMGESFAGRQDAMVNANQSRILQALGLAPTLAQADYTDIDRLTQAGTAFQQQDQRGLDAAYQQFLESRNFPREQLDIMGRALGQSYGQQTSQDLPDPNRAAQALGGALTAAQVYRLLFGE